MMPLEQRVCSPKTAVDGRFEVTSSSASRLGTVSPLRVRLAEAMDEATVTSMACTCNKGGDAGHVHHFVGAPLLRQLTAGVAYRLSLATDGVLHFECDPVPVL